MPSTTAETTSWETERAELQAILQSPLFARSPALSHLLSYLCEKTFAGATDQIKEYSVAIDVFDRRDSFDQDTDSIVRVHANRLRKKLNEYYAGEGAAHELRIVIPVGQYVPQFQRYTGSQPSDSPHAVPELAAHLPAEKLRSRTFWWMSAAAVLLAALVVVALLML